MIENFELLNKPIDLLKETRDFFFNTQTDMNNGTTFDQLENFRSSDAVSELVTGDPEGSMKYWECQGDTQRCSLYSQKFIIEELTGKEIDINEIAKVAAENGWFSEETGTSLINVSKILDYYGIENSLTQYNNIEDIENCLKNGGLVEAIIDSDEIWYGENDNIYTPNDGANHAVEVIGIDRTDSENPCVILNDSGIPNGCGVKIPLNTFMDAWEDSNYTMVAAI